MRTSAGCFCEVRRRFSQDIALHLDPCQLGTQTAYFHLLGTDRLAVGPRELALPMGFDPVEQGLIGHAQRTGCRRQCQAGFDQAHGLLLELQGVLNAVCFRLSHFVSLRLIGHLARDTFFKGKVNSDPCYLQKRPQRFRPQRPKAQASSAASSTSTSLAPCACALGYTTPYTTEAI